MRVETKVFPNEPDPKGYWGNLGEATSQFFQAFIGGNANLAFSEQVGYWQRIGDLRGAFFGSLVNAFFGRNHCEKAWEQKV